MKLILANCTGNVPHTGCLAVTDSQVRALYLAGHELLKVYFLGELRPLWRGNRESTLACLADSTVMPSLQQCDGVVVNGEGTIHHGAGGDLLCLLLAARRISKPTYLVNAVLQDVDGFDDVLRNLNDLTVRDVRSSAFLQARSIPHRIVLDSVLDARFADECDVDLSGRIVCTDWHFLRDRDVGKAIWDFHVSRKQSFFYPLHDGYEAFRWQHAVANFARAHLVVTGRHHGAYLAGLAGVPFVVLPSNTHKLEGLVEQSGLPLPLCTRPGDLEAKARYALANASLFQEFHGYLKSHRPLDTFSAISPPAGVVVDAATVERLTAAFQRRIREMHLCARRRVNPYERHFLKRRRWYETMTRRARRAAHRVAQCFRISGGTRLTAAGRAGQPN